MSRRARAWSWLLGTGFFLIGTGAVAQTTSPDDGAVKVMLYFALGTLMALVMLVLRLYLRLNPLPDLVQALDRRLVAVEEAVATIDQRDTDSRHNVRTDIVAQMAGAELRLRDDATALARRVEYLERQEMERGKS